jgi:preprotein translocase subunit SecB
MSEPNGNNGASNGNGVGNGQDTMAGKQIAVHRIYLKDCSFESPLAPATFDAELQPEVDLNIRSEATDLGENLHEVVLSLTVQARTEQQIAFLVEVQQGGVFGIHEFTNEERHFILGSYCPNVLFPYARETVSALVSRGGLPQLMLQPINFDALYAQRLQEQQGQGEGPPAGIGDDIA